MKAHLDKAREIVNNEFYTFYNDIKKELDNYDLKGKKIYLPCDNENSNFVKYCKDNNLNYVNTYYDEKQHTLFNDYKNSVDCRFNNKYYEWCDVIITNPPFSIISTGINFLMQDIKKDFIIIVPITAPKYKLVVKYIAADKVNFGFSNIEKFYDENNKIKRVTSAGLTTFKTPDISPFKSEVKGSCYDNLSVEKNKCSEIPHPKYAKLGKYYCPINLVSYNFKHCYKIKGAITLPNGHFTRFIIEKNFKKNENLKK